MIETLSALLQLMLDNGAERIYAKKLAPNDNSKNQVYLGGGFGALNIIPHGEIVLDTRLMAGSKQDRPKAPVSFFWVNEDGRYHAPDAQLILYPDYPEVRMSGFLRGCKSAPSAIMRARDAGRVLFMGMTSAGDVLGYAADAQSAITLELNSRSWQSVGIFLELPTDPNSKKSPKAILLDELRRIYSLQWIQSQRLGKDGTRMPYQASNAGGYTLEAELCIIPNGKADPDFMGWEIKQFAVRDFKNFAPKSAITLMTPEPNGGLYKEQGVEAFVRKYGYPDKSGKPDRLNVGGTYTCQKSHHADTGLRMVLRGFNSPDQTIDLSGGIMLVDRDEQVAASWSFTGMMEHWNRKHAQAAYIPSLYREPPPEYAFGSQVLLCEQTDFLLFLRAFASGIVYLDPGIKLENISSTKPSRKTRSQFRIKHHDITRMYHHSEEVSLLS